MSQTAQAHQISSEPSPPHADLIRLLEDNLRLQKRIEAMAEEIAWLKRLHDKELEYRERELALRERSQPVGTPTRDSAPMVSASPGTEPINGHGKIDRREISAADMQAILEATLNGMTPEPEEAPEYATPDQPTAAPPVDAPVRQDAASEAASSTNDELPDIPAFLADPSGRRKKVSLIAPSAKTAGNQPNRPQMQAPKRRRLPGLAGLIG